MNRYTYILISSSISFVTNCGMLNSYKEKINNFSQKYPNTLNLAVPANLIAGSVLTAKSVHHCYTNGHPLGI